MRAKCAMDDNSKTPHEHGIWYFANVCNGWKAAIRTDTLS
jgi:hypothetical protein